MTDEQSVRDEIADEISGITVGSGYYSTTIGIDAAQEAADAIMPLVRRLQSERDKAIATGERILADALKVSAERDRLHKAITEALDEFERLEEACVAVPSRKFFLRILRAAIDKEGGDDE